MSVNLQWIVGLWLAFIGWFLEIAATISYRQALMRDALQGLSVRDVMTVDWPLIRRGLSLERLVQDYILRTGRQSFIVAVEDRLEGIVTLRDIKRVSHERWQTTLVEEIMAPSDKLKIAYPNQDALSLFEQMDELSIAQVPVVEGRDVVGMVDRDSLVHLLRTRK